MNIRRGKPSKHTRHGILIKGLKPSHVATLDKYKFIKESCEDDTFVKMLFDLVDKENHGKNKSKFFIDPTDGEVKDKNRLLDEIRIIPWNCSYCNTKINSRMEDFSIANFCCDSCYEIYTDDGKKVSELVLNNSVEFTEHCKRLINKDRKTFLKYIKNK
jgi:hypothetical protein